MSKIDNYIDFLYLKEEMIHEEELSGLVKSITPQNKTKSMIQNISNSLDEKDIEGSIKKVKRVLMPMPKIKLSKIDNFMNSKYKDYFKLKRTANVILNNSIPGVSKNMLDVASSFIVISSMVAKKSESNKDPKELMKRNIKDFVVKVRSFYDDDEEEVKGGNSPDSKVNKDMLVGYATIAIGIVLAVGVAKSMLVIVSAVFSFWTLLIVGTFIVIWRLAIEGMKTG
jgi:hypothetical protein